MKNPRKGAACYFEMFGVGDLVGALVAGRIGVSIIIIVARRVEAELKPER
jgi:hypothetical protein